MEVVTLCLPFISILTCRKKPYSTYKEEEESWEDSKKPIQQVFRNFVYVYLMPVRENILRLIPWCVLALFSGAKTPIFAGEGPQEDGEP
jgi:hypothetical protein